MTQKTHCSVCGSDDRVCNHPKCPTVPDEIRKYRETLFRAAPSHQGGHSDTGFAIAECLGCLFPLRFPDMETKAKAEGFDPAELWPWLKK